MKRCGSILGTVLVTVVLSVSPAWADEKKQDPKWFKSTEIKEVLKRAKKEEKKIFLDFTGSDWCPPCIQMKKKVFSTDIFAEYAKKKLVLMKIDFPRRKELPKELQKANGMLQREFKARYLPTLVLLNEEGKELGRMMGYQPGGPKAFIKRLEKIGAKKPKEDAAEITL